MSVLGMIPAALVLLGMVAFTDTGMGRGVRRAVRYLWRTIRRQQDGQQNDQNDAPAGTQAGGPIIGPGGQVMVPAIVGQVVQPPGPRSGSWWRSFLPFRRPPAPTVGVGHVNPQVSQQGAQQGPWQGGWQGGWQGTPVGAPTGPAGWPTAPAPAWGTPPAPTPGWYPTDQAWGTGPAPAWGTPPMPVPGWYPTGEAWTGAVPTAQPVPPVVPTRPMPAPGTYPVTQPVTQPVQSAAGVLTFGQGRGVRLDPAPQPVTPVPGVPAAPGAPVGTPVGIPPGGDPAITARRAVVAGMLPQLQATPHGEQGRVIAALAAGLGVDARTVYRDIEALTGGRVIS